MNDVLFMCVQPAIPYYTWQVEVMIDNFLEKGVDPKNIQIVCADVNQSLDPWNKLSEKYKEVNFFFYKDDRFKPGYIPSVRPYVLHKHWMLHPELESKTIFYHDCDIILAQPLDLETLAAGDTCYVSDTVSYLGANYVRSKGEHYLDLMTNIVGVNKQYVIEQEKNSGGAQYILKNIPTSFWNKVYQDCETLYRMVNEQIKKDPPHHALQIWCADMWAVLWNLWVRDKKVEVSDKMSFSWATSPMREWDSHPIYHNAGVTGHGNQFYKGAYINKLPYTEVDLQKLSKEFCSYKYAEQIFNTAKTSILI